VSLSATSPSRVAHYDDDDDDDNDDDDDKNDDDNSDDVTCDVYCSIGCILSALSSLFSPLLLHFIVTLTFFPLIKETFCLNPVISNYQRQPVLCFQQTLFMRSVNLLTKL